jgi:hypothetical protein
VQNTSRQPKNIDQLLPPSQSAMPVYHNPPPPPPQQAAPPTSTIICMVVDKHQRSSLKKSDLQALAAKLASRINAINQQQQLQQQHHLQQQQQQQQLQQQSQVQNLISKKASLPDLTFLSKYDSKPKTNVVTSNQIVPPSQNTTPNKTETAGEDAENASAAAKSSLLVANGNDLLKRKTLKSIKRYRQTKQNTEPCVPNAFSGKNDFQERSYF